MAQQNINLGSTANDGTGDPLRAAGQKMQDMFTEIYTLLGGLGTAATKNTGLSSGNVPLLGSGGLLDASVLPAIAITDTFIVASQSAMLALTAQKGDIAIRSDLNKSFVLSTNSPSTLADWKELLTPTDTVLSVAGLTGTISSSALRAALSALDKAGDTMTGALILNANPSTALGAATKQYVDSAVSGGAASFRGASAYRSSLQSISNATSTAVSWNAEEFDTDSIHDNSSNPSRLTVPSGVSFVDVMATGEWGSPSGAYRYLSIRRNVSNILAGDFRAPLFEAYASISTGPVAVVPGDYFELYVQHDAGGAINFGGSARLKMRIIS